nr:hypothetical protein Hi04_10k_c2089_00016 [uncultured bacterium]
MPVGKNSTVNDIQWNEPQDVSQTIRLQTITPVFGGGYETREVDPLCIIRPAAVRGQLRFWWRAVAGARFSNGADLFRAESELFGSADTPGGVRIRVQIHTAGTEQRCAGFELGDNGRYRAFPKFVQNWPAYALQAFQGELCEGSMSVKREPEIARCGCRFALTISYLDSSRKKELTDAVGAWIKYGGIGARTRRGCGSLSCAEAPQFSPSPVSSETLHPALAGSVSIVGDIVDDPVIAWRDAVNAYRDFRQGEGVARTHRRDKPPGANLNSPGRSWWPEPDSIRRITGHASRGHEPTHPVELGFPRAELGLPIIFHFKDKGQGDPEDTTLHGARDGHDRFASPVITKAIAVDGGYRPLVLVLNTPHVWQFGDLRLGPATRISEAQISLSLAERRYVRPLAGNDVREALIRFVENRWNSSREVIS